MSNINLFPELDNEQGENEEYSHVRNEVRPEEDLIVFGYSCKLFRDDFSAKAIDRGQSLIPWNGDENVMIDRCAKSDFCFLLLLIFLFIIIYLDKSLNEEKQNPVSLSSEFSEKHTHEMIVLLFLRSRSSRDSRKYSPCLFIRFLGAN